MLSAGTVKDDLQAGASEAHEPSGGHSCIRHLAPHTNTSDLYFSANSCASSNGSRTQLAIPRGLPPAKGGVYFQCINGATIVDRWLSLRAAAIQLSDTGSTCSICRSHVAHNLPCSWCLAAMCWGSTVRAYGELAESASVGPSQPDDAVRVYSGKPIHQGQI